MGTLSIVQWDKADRPREKMEELGAGALSNAELLAILIGSGTPEEDAVALMKRILADNDNRLNRLGKKSIAELCAYKGIGKAKAITLLAACELGKRHVAEPMEERTCMNNSLTIYQFYQRLGDLPHEEFHVALLNNRLQLIASRLIGRGGLTETVADVRLVLREALLTGASHIAVCHNHPSGNVTPSQQDNQLTSKLKHSAEVMNIHMIDHIIVGSRGYYSYNDEGQL